MEIFPFFGKDGNYPLPYRQCPHPPVRSPGHLGFETLPPFQTQLRPPSRLSGFSGISSFEDPFCFSLEKPHPITVHGIFFHLRAFRHSFLPHPSPSTRIIESIPLSSSHSLHLKTHPRGLRSSGWDKGNVGFGGVGGKSSQRKHQAAPSTLGAAQNPQNILGSASFPDQIFSSVSLSSLIRISLPWFACDSLGSILRR